MADNSREDIIMRQTDYTREVATNKLLEHNNDILAIIREYNGPVKKIIKPVKSVNQQIYTEIRGLMDDAAATYNSRKGK
jgi:hypothetical protein